MIEMVKTRKQKLQEKIKQLESYIYEGNDSEQLKKVFKDNIDFLREELKGQGIFGFKEGK